MLRTALLLLLLSACSPMLACGHIQPTPTPAPGDATCAAVCARGFDMGCGWSTPTPRGATCTQVCEHADAIGEPWRLECLAGLTGCTPLCP